MALKCILWGIYGMYVCLYMCMCVFIGPFLNNLYVYQDLKQKQNKNKKINLNKISGPKFKIKTKKIYPKIFIKIKI